MRRLLPTALALLAPLGAAPGAQANHVTASVSATATLGKAVTMCQREDGDDASVCTRGRRVVISYQASCVPGAPPDVYGSVEVAIVGIKPDGTRYTVAGPYPTYEMSGTETIDVGPGTRFVAETVVTCDTFNPAEVIKTSASSEEFFLAPRVVADRTVFHISISCHRIPTSKLDVWLQAGDRSLLGWDLWYGQSLLMPGVPETRQIRLFARGAGVNVSGPPNRRMLRRYHVIGLPVTPRRGGTLNIWATINGQRTDTLPVKVLSRRC